MLANTFVILELYLDHPGENPPKPDAQTTLELIGPFKEKEADLFATQAVTFPRCKHATILTAQKPFDLTYRESL